MSVDVSNLTPMSKESYQMPGVSIPPESSDSQSKNQGETIFSETYDLNSNNKADYIKEYKLDNKEEKLVTEMFDKDENSIYEKKSEYDNNGKLKTESLYNNSTGKLSKETEYDSDGKIKSVSRYEYSEDGLYEKATKKDSKGNIIETDELTRNKNGNIESRLTKNADGKIEYGVYSEFNKDGSVKSETWLYDDYGYTYTFDKDGNSTITDFERPTLDITSAKEAEALKEKNENILDAILRFFGFKK